MERTTMKFVMIKKSCLRFFVLLLSLYLLSVQNTVNALTFKTDGFSVTTIDDTSFARMKGKTYKDNCTVPLSELRHVKVLYKNKEQQTLKGEIVCNKHIADDVADIVPVTHDEYQRTINNPFRGPNKRRVLRLDIGKLEVELISSYNVGTYTIRYIKRPEPIVLCDLEADGLDINGVVSPQTCQLSDLIH